MCKLEAWEEAAASLVAKDRAKGIGHRGSGVRTARGPSALFLCVLFVLVLLPLLG